MLAKSTLEIIEDMMANGQYLCPVCKFKNDCRQQCVDTVVANGAIGLMDYIVIQDKDALINQLLIIRQEEA